MKSSLSTKAAWQLTANEAYNQCAAPAVSVIITLYNYAAYIEGCLNSVLASKAGGIPGGFEVIVVDDASTDSSADLAEDYIAASPLPACLVKKAINTGVADARNLGLLIARAPLVFMLDADNEIRPECLQVHYEALAASGQAMAYGIINRFDSATRQSLGTLSDSEWNVRNLVAGSLRIDTMAMIRKEALLHVGGYSTEYRMALVQGWEDYDLCLKLAQAGYAGKFIPQVLSDYRVHAGSMINRALPMQAEVSAYQARKFFALARACDDAPVLFGTSRLELETAYTRAVPAPLPQIRRTPPRLVHRLLGKKIRRSLNKRLNAIYAWLNK
ncbi:MAG TPA: glycosyltransferase family 2 protein [Candidatus Acidoferrales bacterium]|jgi:glycosyltransferase involved in cell wall biosynthesis|nr:glycosyltransferase family 2 protein [Candidatus Acidoferrales bacterium]